MTSRLPCTIYGAVLTASLATPTIAQAPTTQVYRPAHSVDQNLLQAVAAGNLTDAAAALDAGANIETRDTAGRTPLILAAIARNSDMLRLLIARHADVNAKDASGNTAVTIVLKHARSNTPATPMELPAAPGGVIDLANVARSARALERAVPSIPSPQTFVNPNTIRRTGRSASNTAGNIVGGGLGKLFGSTVGHIAGGVTRTVVRGATGLAADATHAVQAGQPQKLARKGLNIAAKAIEDNAPSIHLPTAATAQASAAGILSKMKKTLSTDAGRALLAPGQIALAKGHALDFTTPGAWTSIVSSLAQNNPGALLGLLSSFTGSPFEDRNNMLLLIAEAVKSDASLANAFFERDRDPQADQHATELVQAALTDNVSLVRTLIMSGAGDPFSALSYTALRSAAGFLLPSLPGQLVAQAGLSPNGTTQVTSIVAMLLDAGADANTQDAEGVSALMWAVRAGSAGVTRLLLDHGANRALQDGSGIDALGVAVQNGMQEIADMLR